MLIAGSPLVVHPSIPPFITMEAESIELQRRSTQSFHSAETSFVPRRSQTPTAPHPSSSTAEVQVFLINAFLYYDDEMTLPEAKNLAAKMRMNGYGLYETSKDVLTTTLGYRGDHIYSLVLNGPYGYVC